MSHFKAKTLRFMLGKYGFDGYIIWKRQKFKLGIVWVPEQADALHRKAIYMES